MAASTRSKAGDPPTSNNAGTDDKRNVEDAKPNTDSIETPNTAQPLGPPPRPSQAGNDKDGYFGQSHSATNNDNNGDGNKGSRKNGLGYHTEPNPFEEQFGNPSTDTPGKFGLPPLASLTSPSSLMPNDTPGWNSLRSGPLSPAMLAGPSGGGYFDQPYGRGFPTPNESSIRTGLTPGGGGSMFPAPSPGTAAIFNAITINTPNTMDFMRSSITSKSGINGSGPTSQPVEAQTSPSNIEHKISQGQSANAFDSSNHPDADAANGLFMLAQSNGARTANGYPSMSQAPTQQMMSSTMAPSVQPVSAPARGRKTSMESNSAMEDQSDSEEEPPKPAPRGRKRGAAVEPKANNRRKAVDTPAKAPAAKKARNSLPSKFEFDPNADASEEEEEVATHHKDGRKMTDEEKRKNFLERNRVAALKCRQRKKQWLANLQSKCDLYSQENDALTHTVNQLREQVFQLKQVLITHKDCPGMASQGFNQQVIASLVNQDIMMGFQQNGVPGPHMQQHAR